MKPILLSKQELKLGVIASIAISPDGERVYLGRSNSSDPDRQNLVVVPINATDGSTGSPKLYRDSNLPLPLHATFPSAKSVSTSLPIILTDPRYRKLYLIAQHDMDGRLRPSRYLTVYDLDRKGDPVGEPRSYETGKIVNGTVNPAIVATVQGMCLHPTLDRLYLVGFGWHGVRYYTLSPDGEPQPDSYEYKEIPTNAAGKFAIAVSQDGKRLYLGSLSTKPLDQLPVDDLQIIELDGQGIPQVATLKTFSSNAFEPGKTKADYLRFVYTSQALYRIPREWPDGLPKSAWPLLVWPLDPTTGLPVGNGFQSIDALQQSAFAVDPLHQMLWLAQDGTAADAFSGQLSSDRTLPLPVAVNSRGLPLLDQLPKVSPVFRQEGVFAAVAARTGQPVFLLQDISTGTNYHKDYHFRITLLATEAITPPTPTAFKCSFTTYRDKAPIINIGDSPLTLNQTSAWQNLDVLLRDRPDQVLLIITLAGKPLKHLKLQIEIALGNPNTTPPTKASPTKMLVETVVGNQALFLVPGYRFHPEQDRQLAIEPLSQHAKQYLQTAQTVALKPEERPKQFIVSCLHCIGGQGHLEQLQAQVAAIKALGFNTAAVYNWGNLPPQQINSLLDAEPEHPFYRASALYTPMSGPPLNLQSLLNYFDFFYDGSIQYQNTPITVEALNLFAQTLANQAQATSGTPLEKMVNLAISDEPGWVYPPMLKLFSHSPSLEDFNPAGHPPLEWVDSSSQPNHHFLQQFRDYLAQQGLTPVDLGQADWSQIYALGAATATPTNSEGLPTADITLRRLFYWTIRFFADSAAKGHGMVQAALQKEFGGQLQVYANWNNWVNTWYIPAPHQNIFKYPNHGLDTAGGGFDWFTSGRLNAHTLWTEDEFYDNYSQKWSFYGDVLNSAASRGNRSFGAYVRAYGNRIGDHAAGASYKLLSLIGHGAKTLNVYSYGSAFLFGNGWSEQFDTYEPIAEAIKLIGRSERVLFPGQPVPAQIAILLPNASRLWDDKTYAPYYLIEIQYLHFALIHAGYRVEFVDDFDIAQGLLSTRSFTTLYLTGPNLSAAAQSQVQAWVAAGGTLVVTPGGGVANEYNEPSTHLDEVLGLQPGSRQPVRASADGALLHPPTYKLQINDPALLELLGHDTPLELPLRDLYQYLLPDQPNQAPKTIAGPAFAPLQPQGASIIGTLMPLSGTAAPPQPSITLHHYGQGQAVAYSFYPGWQYWNTPLHPANLVSGPLYTDRLPRQWGQIERQLAIIPALLVNTPKPVVVSHEVVEVCRLQSVHGIALVILNWTDEPIQTLTMEVPDVGGHTTVTSAQGSPITSQMLAPNTLKLQLPIKAVDVVLIE
jgi:hypothetical protein